MTSVDNPVPRRPLNRERVLLAAMSLADEHGLEALTMRALGGELGVEAMALYKHVANKDEILDGLVELVVAEIEVPPAGSDWRSAMRDRAISARRALRRHRWSIGLLESRGSAGPATLRYLDAVLGCLRAGGFSVEMAAHAFWLLDSYVYGHVVQEMSLPFDTTEDLAKSTGQILETTSSEDFPHLVEIATEQVMTGSYDVEKEFVFGLELILDALEGLVS